jgi:bacterioferritin-associated ferredoxin
MIVCLCKAVSERTLRAAIRAGARTIADLAEATAASTDCGTCAEHLDELLADELGTMASNVPAPEPPRP